jgi:hypothetical protein
MHSCVDLVNMPVHCGAHPSINAAMPRASILSCTHHALSPVQAIAAHYANPVCSSLSGNVDLPYWATLFCMGQQAYPLIVFRH